MPKILLVEDDRLERSILESILGQNFKVVTSIDGLDVHELVKKEAPELILLDIILPGKNGFDILAELKADDATKNIPVIIVSNLGQEEEIAKGKALGAVDYHVKANIDIYELAALVHNFFKD